MTGNQPNPLPSPAGFAGASGNACDMTFLSPSLQGPEKAGPAFETKFLLRTPEAELVIAWAGQHLGLDPHVKHAAGYRVHSVYFDTAHLDVFHRSPGYRRSKFRLRSYDSENFVHLEQKRKSGDRVDKRRTRITEHQLAMLIQPATSDWEGSWFQRRIAARALCPRCTVSYERLAFIGSTGAEPLRLTLDRQIACTLTSTYALQVHGPALPLLEDRAVLELKYAVAMPSPFKRLVEDLNLAPAGISKYRLGIEAWGLTAEAREVG